jgi:PilZ domain
MEKPSTPSNRRAAYRVVPDAPHALDIDILSQRQNLVQAVIEDVAISGARIRLERAPAMQAPLCAGEQVTLAMRSLRYNYAQTVAARVVKVCDDETSQTVHLAFEGELGTTPMQDDTPYALFNRRALPRGIMPASGVGLEAEVMTSDVTARNVRSYAVAVRNFSHVGINLCLSASSHRALGEHDELSLTLRLPGRPSVHRIACQVRHRRFDDGDFVYGCAYDWSETMDPHAVAKDLLDFMLDHSEAS